MPKGLTPKTRNLVRTSKRITEVMNRKGKSGLPSITEHGRRKKT